MSGRTARCIDIADGDVVLVHTSNNSGRATEVPVVIHLEDDTIMLDVYLHDDDGHADRTVRIPIADLEAGWNP